MKGIIIGKIQSRKVNPEVMTGRSLLSPSLIGVARIGPTSETAPKNKEQPIHNRKNMVKMMAIHWFLLRGLNRINDILPESEETFE
jgi:hypothetical protein